MEQPLLSSFMQVGTLIVQLGLYLATTLVLIGAADYGYQWWKHERDIMMTKDQVKREVKEMDGDPLIVQRRREAHRKLLAAKNIRATSFATALLTNPTHVAIAFKYEPPEYPLPIIIAKGLDEVALKMREIAAEHDIPIIERPELARRLYRDVEVGQPIPEDLYGVFLEILKYVYSITGKVPELRT
jgi:flagellar biosynthetic protein FlhB